jgi:hypothetical protein
MDGGNNCDVAPETSFGKLQNTSRRGFRNRNELAKEETEIGAFVQLTLDLGELR